MSHRVVGHPGRFSTATRPRRSTFLIDHVTVRKTQIIPVTKFTVNDHVRQHFLLVAVTDGGFGDFLQSSYLEFKILGQGHSFTIVKGVAFLTVADNSCSEPRIHGIRCGLAHRYTYRFIWSQKVVQSWSTGTHCHEHKE
jgi:hypothetical protein